MITKYSYVKPKIQNNLTKTSSANPPRYPRTNIWEVSNEKLPSINNIDKKRNNSLDKLALHRSLCFLDELTLCIWK